MVTPDDITTALKDIGLRKVQTVMVHTSLSSLGYVCGGAQSVIEAFKADFLPLPQERTKPQKHFVFAALWRFWNSFLLFFIVSGFLYRINCLAIAIRSSAFISIFIPNKWWDCPFAFQEIPSKTFSSRSELPKEMNSSPAFSAARSSSVGSQPSGRNK